MARNDLALTQQHLDVIGQEYGEVGLSTDELPYMPEFADLHACCCQRLGVGPSEAELWRALERLRKAKKLARKKR